MAHQIDKAAGFWKTGKERFLIIMKGFVLLSFVTIFAIMVNLNPSTSNAQVACDCTACHSSSPHGPDWTGCSGCHDSPPQTGTHLIHYGSGPLAALSYSDTSVSNTNLAYKFGCGNCHPLDFTKHNNGVVDVELYNANSPAGSIKAMNPVTAAYTPGLFVSTYASKIGGGRSFSYSNGTCNNIYCHSGYTITSGPVGSPLLNQFRRPILDQYGNPTYAPYTVTYSRVYKTTPEWGTSGTFSTCTECHEFPLTTSYPSVQAGVGDSHQWVDEYGYGNLHAYNMGYEPLSCKTCHYGIVTQPNTWSETSYGVTIYNPVMLASRQLHVNGTRDVLFDTTTPADYISTSMWGSPPASYDLTGAVYDPAAKTCSNVGCHQAQTTVTWGAPYRTSDSTECNLCHQM